MPASATTFIIPGGFHPGWSLLGRVLRRFTGDRLRAEAWHIVILTAAALAWLMGVYVSDAAGVGLALPPATRWAVLAGAALLVAVGGLVGVRPRAAVTCTDGGGVRVSRGRQRVTCAAVTDVQTVSARCYHRRHRPRAAVRPFLRSARAPVLLVHTRGGAVLALGLDASDRRAFQQRVERERARQQAHQNAPRPRVAAP